MTSTGARAEPAALGFEDVCCVPWADGLTVSTWSADVRDRQRPDSLETACGTLNGNRPSTYLARQISAITPKIPRTMFGTHRVRYMFRYWPFVRDSQKNMTM